MLAIAARLGGTESARVGHFAPQNGRTLEMPMDNQSGIINPFFKVFHHLFHQDMYALGIKRGFLEKSAISNHFIDYRCRYADLPWQSVQFPKSSR